MENNHTTTPGPAADMPRPHPLIGRIVIYRATEKEFRPAIIIRAWSGTCAQLAIIPDGSNDGAPMNYADQGADSRATLYGMTGGRFEFVWKTSVSRGEGIGMWRLPEDFYPAQEALAELKTCEGKLCAGFTCVSEHPCGEATVLNVNDQGQVESAEVVKLQEATPANTVSCNPRTIGDAPIGDTYTENKGPGGGGPSGVGSSFGGCSKTNA
ncbi:hypothetical protein FDZ73_20660 [bacterium]|nr:MAG: hypothetical protein FDZ73_20660 [bacterium]